MISHTSMIGIQSTANQRQVNGLSTRTPYDVGRSMRTCSSTPIVDTIASMPNEATSAFSTVGSRFRLRSELRRTAVALAEAVSGAMTRYASDTSAAVAG